MRLAICDDNQKFCEKEKKILEESILTCTTIDIFLSGEVLLDAYTKDGYRADFVFMDIELKEENGIEIAGQINQVAPATQIVYVTNYIHYATDAYQTEHCYFVLKSDLAQRIPEIIEKVQEQTKPKKIIVIDMKHNQQVIICQDICYIERDMRKSYIHLKEKTIQTKMRLVELMEQLSEDHFFRCHNSYIISLDQVEKLEKTDFQMLDGTKVPISRPNIKRAREAFAGWAARQLR